jgi:hypothetical protein
VASLREASRSWSRVPPARAHGGDDIDPDLETLEQRGRRGERYVRVIPSNSLGFEREAPGWLEVTARATAPIGDFGRFRARLRTILLGAPLPTQQQSHERLTKLKALAVLSSDALSSSQAGMVSRWLRRRERGWRMGLVITATGTVITALVLAINGIFRFVDGAGVIVFIVPLLVAGCCAKHRHYAEVSSRLTTEIPTSPDQLKLVCLVPIADLNSLALQSLAMARSISDNVIAVHICDDEDHSATLRAKWEVWGNHVPLEIVESPYRSFIRPLLRYIDAIDKQRSDDTLVSVLPELVATRWWHLLLHNQSALRLKAQLLFRPGTVVVDIPYHLQQSPHARRIRRRRDRGDSDDIEAI